MGNSTIYHLSTLYPRAAKSLQKHTGGAQWPCCVENPLKPNQAQVWNASLVAALKKKKNQKKHLKWRNKSLLNLSEKTTVATQCRHDTVAASDSAERGSELCRRDPCPGYLKCTWVLCTIYPSTLQYWGKLRGRQVLRKGLCFTDQRWNNPSLVGFKHAKRKEKLVPTQSGKEGMSASIGKPWPVAAEPIGWAGMGQSHPTHILLYHCCLKKSHFRCEKGLWHPSITQWLYRPVSTYRPVGPLVNTVVPLHWLLFLPWRQYSNFYMAVLDLTRAAWSSCQSESVG